MFPVIIRKIFFSVGQQLSKPIEDYVESKEKKGKGSSYVHNNSLPS